jgi:ankyrin repeat protein
VDPRGRTPLHLAVTLGHLESVRVLLRHDANANAENSRYWTGKIFFFLLFVYVA